MKLENQEDSSDSEIFTISKIADQLGFFAHNHLGFTENSPKKRKYSVSGGSVDTIARGENRMVSLVQNAVKGIMNSNCY